MAKYKKGDMVRPTDSEFMYVVESVYTDSDNNNWYKLEDTNMAIREDGLMLLKRSTVPTIKVKYFGDTEPITKNPKGDWIDLRSSVDMKLKKGEFYLIPLGVAMKLPEGMTGLILPRSSTFKNWGTIQANSCGVVDSSYCGDTDQWLYPVYATRDAQIHRGDRICQFAIMDFHMRDYFIERVDTLGGEKRGGFGSTGVK